MVLSDKRTKILICICLNFLIYHLFEAATLHLCVLCMLLFFILWVHVLPCPWQQQKIDFYASILSLVAIFVGVDVVAQVAVLLC
jgi:hypothetical protein